MAHASEKVLTFTYQWRNSYPSISFITLEAIIFLQIYTEYCFFKVKKSNEQCYNFFRLEKIIDSVVFRF